ncbi:MAG TPA: MoaD/ThiS family protein [Candidatus Binataceae bacterium]|nr:MoaD/ThiS family protein [Candidatus Binataceae bacterium]
MATVVIPSLLRKYTGGADRVTVSGRTIGQVIEELVSRFPEVRDHLLENGDVKPSVAVSIDGEMGTGGVLDRVGETSEIFFIPAIGGGC